MYANSLKQSDMPILWSAAKLNVCHAALSEDNTEIPRKVF